MFFADAIGLKTMPGYADGADKAFCQQDISTK
jgi:hypothetical protein